MNLNFKKIFFNEISDLNLNSKKIEIKFPIWLMRCAHHAVSGLLRQPDVLGRGFLLDGFPRNAEQHAALHDAGFTSRLCAILLHAPRDTLSRSIRYRRLDPDTDVLYNLKLRPPSTQEVLEWLIVLAKDSAANVTELFASYGRALAETYDLLLAASAERVDADRAFDVVLRDVAYVLTMHGVRPLRQ